ncbi:MAG: hypothetical protein ACR2FJ_04905 [Qipengyuania sp.]
MKFGKLALAASAASLAVAPIAGQAVAAERVAAPVTAESELGNEDNSSLIIILAILAIGIGIFAFDSDPVST